MIGRARRSADRNGSAQNSGAAPGAPRRGHPGEPSLDQLFAEPIVQQLMRRDKTDEAAIRRLLQQAAAAWPILQGKGDPNPDDPNAVARMLYDAARLLCRRYDRELRARLPGLTRARCTILVHLAQHPGISQAALAQTLDIRPPTLVHLLDRLETAGFIARRPDPEDRRAHVLMLTTKALPIIECIYDLTRMIYYDLQVEISKAEATRSPGPIRTNGRV